MDINIAILTPLEVEYKAVRRYLNNIQRQDVNGLVYEVGYYNGDHHIFRIIMRQTGSKNADIALATEKILNDFNPDIIFLVGIAGGVKDVKIGDVVVGTKAYGFESGKAMDDYVAARPDSIPYDINLIEQARYITNQDNWEQNIINWQPSNKVIFGPIASSDKVIASTKSPEYQLLKRSFNDTTALEMEAIGFAKAAFAHHIKARMMNIRGISDLLDHKTDDGHPLAAAQAAAFTFTLLYQLNCNGLIIKSVQQIASIHKDITLINKETTDTLRKMIGNNRIKQAIEQLLHHTDGKDEDLHEQVINLQRQWTNLQREKIMGLLSFSEENLASNKVVNGLLQIINQLE
ncbi:MAG: hypothetical protein ACK4TA_06350 [Saprospiraceae bacterium]